MTTIELTGEQRRLMRSEQGNAVPVVDPDTKQCYVLLVREHYDRIMSLLEKKAEEFAAVPTEVPPGILRSQQAFWRDLPELLKNKKNRGKWVCYHGNERIGIAKKSTDLIQQCLRRGLKNDEYDLDIIEPHELPPWEPEEIEMGGHEVDDEEIFDQPEAGNLP
jgi:hypothetical protein